MFYLKYQFALKHNIDEHKGRKYYKKLMLGLKMTYYDGKLWLYSKHQNSFNGGQWCKREITIELAKQLVGELG